MFLFRRNPDTLQKAHKIIDNLSKDVRRLEYQVQRLEEAAFIERYERVPFRASDVLEQVLKHLGLQLRSAPSVPACTLLEPIDTVKVTL